MTEPEQPEPTDTPLSNRQMLAMYFGLDRQPPVRPDWRTDLGWVVPVALVLAGWLAWRSSSVSRGAIIVLVVAAIAVIAYSVALRVRSMALLERHEGVRLGRRR